MAKQLQLFFDKVIENENKAKDIKRMIKDSLLSSQQFVELSEQRKKITDKLKQTKEIILSDYNKELDKLEDLKVEVEHDKLLISDKALNDLMKGKAIDPLEDKDGNKYEPIISVKFKKIK